MGKPTGFLEYTRREDGRRPAAERVRDWEEFHLPLPEEIRRQQGARCMNCGVPFCQAGMIYEGKAFGCPLHNLIPEWNDMILSGNWGHALSRPCVPRPLRKRLHLRHLWGPHYGPGQ